jgi:glycosyltransferase involved in cell wall biosynthesis
MTTVVSVTSMSVERDSRTFKFAASAARLGYRSIVVEGERSELLPGDLPFQLVSPPRPAPPPADGSPPAAPSSPSPIGGADEHRASLPVRVGRRLPGPIADPLRRLQVLIALIRDQLRSVQFSISSNLRDYRRRNTETRSLLPDGDIYWLHSFIQFPAVYLKARRQRARFLYDTPDAYWEPGQTTPHDRAVRGVMRFFEGTERFCARRAESFTTVSDGVAELLGRRFGRRPEVLRNCHDVRLDARPKRDIRAVTGVDANDLLLVMTGNLKPGMAVAAGLRALRDLPAHVHLAFVGRGHERSTPLVDELGVAGRAHLLPPIAPTEIVNFIRTADASPILYRAITLNYLYALPNGFFHAVAAGLPVLFPALPEIRAVAMEHQLGVEIDCSDPASIVAAVEKLDSDPKARAEYRNNVERARRVLSWEREEQILARILSPK